MYKRQALLTSAARAAAAARAESVSGRFASTQPSTIRCAASVFVNYDGVSKHRTTVGDHCRMGSDTMYVGPLTIGDGVYSGAGSVIRHDVPAGALTLTDAPQRIVEGWVEANRPDTDSARAAAAARAADVSSADVSGASEASGRHTGDNGEEPQR